MLLTPGRVLVAMVLVAGLVVSCHAPVSRAVPSAGRTAVAPIMDPAKVRGKAGHGVLETRLGYYYNGDGQGDGNPFLDEELTVIEPVIYLDYNTSEDTAYWGKFSYDNVSSASIERLNSYPGTEQSGATGDYYFGIDAGRRHQSSETSRHDYWVHGSAEYDYRSFGLGGSLSYDSGDRNTTNKFAGNFFYDNLDLIQFNGREMGSDNRLSVTGTWTQYQVLAPTRHAEYGVTLTYQNGFLGTPFNAVVLEDPTLAPNPQLFNNARGIEVAERLPDSRVRVAVHGRVRQHLSDDTALEIGGRVYADDWGLVSVSLEPRVYQWLIPNKLRGRLRYRYYNQSAADDFGESFTVADANREFFTQDADLGDFDTHTLGLGLTWLREGGGAVMVGGDFVKRSDGIDQVFLSVGMSWAF